MKRTMTPARKAALRKAQLASAAKRRRGGRKPVARRRMSKRTRRVVMAGGAIVAAGATVHVAGKHSNTVKAKKTAAKKKIQAKARSVKSSAKSKVVHRAENNHAVRVAATKKLMAEGRAKARPPAKGMKMDKKYRMGRPDVRKKRKAAKYG